MEPMRLERNSITYTGVIDACARGGELQKALTLFTYMEVNPLIYMCIHIYIFYEYLFFLLYIPKWS